MEPKSSVESSDSTNKKRFSEGSQLPSRIGSNQSNLIYPVRQARVHIPSKEAKSQEVYVRFYLWDVQKEKFILKRMYSHRGIKFKDNHILAQNVCTRINTLLSEGHVIDRTKKVEKYIQKKVNPDIECIEALRWSLTMKQRIRPRTMKTYEHHLRAFEHFINNHYDGIPLSSINKEIIEQFLVHIKTNRNLGTRSISNFIISLKAMFNVLIENEYMTKNPMRGFKTTTMEINKNFAYNDKQKYELIDYAQQYPWIQFAMRFMYYTLMRSSEMSRIQIKEIGMLHSDQLYLPKEKSKVARERNIQLHPKLLQFIYENKIDRLPGDYYLFGSNFKPNEIKWNESQVGKYYRKKILTPLGYNAHHAFTSWKHTGVCTLHKNGVADYEIMTQAGWSTYKAFQNYLKSLGLQKNPDVINMIDEI